MNQRLIAALIQTIFPDWPALPPADRARVAQDTTTFVAGQIEALPRFLHVPYLLALTGFNWLAVLYGGRTFTRLPPPRRSRYLRFWSESPLGLMRDFVKMVRSCAVLAAFDHPTMTRRLEEVTQDEREGNGR